MSVAQSVFLLRRLTGSRAISGVSGVSAPHLSGSGKPSSGTARRGEPHRFAAWLRPWLPTVGCRSLSSRNSHFPLRVGLIVGEAGRAPSVAGG